MSAYTCSACSVEMPRAAPSSVAIQLVERLLGQVAFGVSEPVEIHAQDGNSARQERILDLAIKPMRSDAHLHARREQQTRDIALRRAGRRLVEHAMKRMPLRIAKRDDLWWDHAPTPSH